MEVENTANNPIAGEVAEVQEPSGSLNEATETTTEGTGTAEEQPLADSKAGKEVKGVDLNKAIAKLSPEEQKAYKAFQAEYTKNQQTLSNYEKQNIAYDDYIRNLTSDPDVVAIIKAKEAKAKAEPEPDFSKMSDQEIFDYSVDKRVKAQMSELESKMESKYGSFIQNKLVDEGNKLMKDFAESKKITVEEVRELSKYAINHRVPLEDAYKVAYADKIPEQAKQEALEDLELKKNANLELGNIPSGAAPVMPSKPSFTEAADMAEKITGLKWSKVKTE